MTNNLTFSTLSVGDTIRITQGTSKDGRFLRSTSMIVGEIRQIDTHPLYGDYFLIDNDLKIFFRTEGHAYEVVKYSHLPKADGLMWMTPNGSDDHTSHFATVYGHPANDVWSIDGKRVMGKKLKEIIGSSTIRPFNFT